MAELATGRPGQVVADLAPHAEQHPTRENVVGLLMTALYRCGRQAEALAVYRATRRHLVEVLGVEAGPELQRLHEQILRHDPTLDGPRISPKDDEWVPRQLPASARGFTGRDRELAALNPVLDGLSPQSGTRVVVVSGMGGVGKTALAVHWARLHGDIFPDGQLYIDLHGFDPRPRR